MADITVTAAKVGLIDPDKAEVIPVVCAEAVTAGQVGYQTSSGTFGVADANAAGKQQARGIFLKSAGAGQGNSLLIKGRVAGFTLTQAYDAVVYLSDTAGAVGDAAGTMTVRLGRVCAMSDKPDYTKSIMFDFDWAAIWA